MSADKTQIIDDAAFAQLEDLALDDIPVDPFGAPAGTYRGLLSLFIKKLKKRDGEEAPFLCFEFKPQECLEQTDAEEQPFDPAKAKIEFLAEYNATSLSRLRKPLMAIGAAVGTKSTKDCIEKTKGAECTFTFTVKPAPTDDNPDRKFRNLKDLVMA